jgi:hypothetical protein
MQHVFGKHIGPTVEACVDDIVLYVAATTQVVSTAAVVERAEEGHALPVQRLVYFISEVLSETKVHYPQI